MTNGSASIPGIRCHNDACCAGQKPCPTPTECGFAAYPPVTEGPMSDIEFTEFWGILAVEFYRTKLPEDNRDQIKELTYRLDPECWVSYSGKPKPFKQLMDKRRTDSMNKAAQMVHMSQQPIAQM